MRKRWKIIFLTLLAMLLLSALAKLLVFGLLLDDDDSGRQRAPGEYSLNQ